MNGCDGHDEEEDDGDGDETEDEAEDADGDEGVTEPWHMPIPALKPGPSTAQAGLNPGLGREWGNRMIVGKLLWLLIICFLSSFFFLFLA